MEGKLKGHERENSHHKMRAEQSRLLEERTAQISPTFSMDYKSPYHFDKHEIPEGWEYYWVGHSVHGDEQIGRTTEMRRKGWDPVPADWHPDRAFTDVLGRSSHLTGTIFYGGCMLYKRPESYGRMERAAFIKKNSELLHCVPGAEEFANDQGFQVGGMQGRNQSWVSDERD
jgi:hypothetical protein